MVTIEHYRNTSGVPKEVGCVEEIREPASSTNAANC